MNDAWSLPRIDREAFAERKGDGEALAKLEVDGEALAERESDEAMRGEPTPISGPASAKLLIFVLILLPWTVVGVGALALLFVAFGLVMAHRSHDFSHIEAAARNLIVLCWLAVVGSLVTAFGALTHSLLVDSDPDLISVTIGLAVLASVAFLYVLSTRHLFLAPLAAHREWIALHGVTTRDRSPAGAEARSGTPIVGSEHRVGYSVADELTKWTGLLEGGHISTEEFQGARRRLLHGGT